MGQVQGIPRLELRDKSLSVSLSSPLAEWTHAAPDGALAEILHRLRLDRAGSVELPIWEEGRRGRHEAESWVEQQSFIIKSSGFKERISESIEAALIGLLSYLPEGENTPALCRGWVKQIVDLGRQADGLIIPRESNRPLVASNPSRGIKMVSFKQKGTHLAHLIDRGGSWRRLESPTPEGLIRLVEEVSRGADELIPACLSGQQDWILDEQRVSAPLDLPAGGAPRAEIILLQRGGPLSPNPTAGNWFKRPALSEGLELSPRRVGYKDWDEAMSLTTQGGILHRSLAGRKQRVPHPSELQIIYRPENPYI